MAVRFFNRNIPDECHQKMGELDSGFRAERGNLQPRYRGRPSARRGGPEREIPKRQKPQGAEYRSEAQGWTAL